MAFVNERISPADVEKYKFPTYGTAPENCNFHWTIDRERDIYFQRIRNGREEDSRCMYCRLYWKGTLLDFNIWIEDTGGYFAGQFGFAIAL